MDLIEKEIRARLAQREVEKMRDYLNRHPEITKYMEKMYEDFKNTLLEDKKIKEKGLREIEEEGVETQLERELCELCKKDIARTKEMTHLFKELLTIDELAGQAEGRYSISAASFQDTFQKLGLGYDEGLDELSDGLVDWCGGLNKLKRETNELQEDEEEQEEEINLEDVSAALLEIQAGFGDFIKHVRARQEIVDTLSGLAAEKGIEYATKDEIVYNAIRKVFPTKEEFENYIEKSRDLMIYSLMPPTFALAELAIAADVDLDEEYASDQLTSKYFNFFIEHSCAQELEEAKRIYG